MIDADRDQLYLRLIAEAIDDVHRRIALTDLVKFLNDRDEQALTAFRLLIIGENANKLSGDLRSRHSDLPWHRIIAFRNIMAHEYHRADPALIWEAASALGEIEVMVDAEIIGQRQQGQ
jgi:uncharacterized protein with HEPN domain